MVKNQKEYQKFLLALLLHDIGKFYQRTEARLDLATSGDSYDPMNFAVKVKDGPKPVYSHLHSCYTAKFFRENLPEHDEAGVLGALHHNPANAKNDRERYLVKLIALADRLSSGERIKREGSEEEGKPSEEPLISIFSQLKTETDGKSKAEKVYYLPLSPLDETLEALFPVEEKKQAFKDGHGQKTYSELWRKFISELKNLKKENLFTQIYYLLQKYTLAIPSATYLDKPDISLFHHSKSTAAIGACLYLLGDDGSNVMNEQVADRMLEELSGVEPDSPPDDFGFLKREDFILLGGDISGIQDFIYQVTSENALKGLRARSFYLQLLSELISRKIIRETELTEANVLYCGGGNFYLLLPNRPDVVDKLNKLQIEIDELLLEAHQGKLSAILAWKSISYYSLLDFTGVWGEISRELAVRKKRKFARLLQAEGTAASFRDKVLGPFHLGGERKACEICGDEFIPENEQDKICRLCHSFVDLTGLLNRADYLVIEPVEKVALHNRVETWQQVGEGLGFRCTFIQEMENSNKYYRNAYRLNSLDFPGKADGFIFIARLMGENKEKGTITLEDMAKVADGIKKWGALRADVDRLGEVFNEGLKQNKTISRVSMLSSMISLYFNTRISQLQKWVGRYSSNQMLAANLYVVYSGGDDLFILGPWSELTELAGIIRDDFLKFSCGRLTISAGIYFAPGRKFPVYQAARMAGEAEEQAKNDGRNRLNIFGESVDWEAVPRIYEIIRLMTSLLKGENGREAPRSLLNVFYNVYQDKILQSKDKIPMQRIWRMHYALRKLMGKLDEAQKQKVERLLQTVLINYEIYPYLNIATRVADYLTRKQED